MARMGKEIEGTVNECISNIQQYIGNKNDMITLFFICNGVFQSVIVLMRNAPFN